MTVAVIPFSNQHAADWDDFVRQAPNGTFLHTRKFLSYHGERYADASLVFQKRGRTVGVLPAAASPYRSYQVISHPGATFGGVVHHGELLGDRMLDAFAEAAEIWAAQGFRQLVYRPVPNGYSDVIMNDDIYALYQHGARQSRCQLSSVVTFGRQRGLTLRRRRSLRKSLSKCNVITGVSHLRDFWPILESALYARHQSQPTHTFEEISKLFQMFPDGTRLVCATIDGQMEAGIVLFRLGRSFHCQYIAASAAGLAAAALDSVFDAAFRIARDYGAEYFDFGTSNGTPDGSLNASLYEYKSEFGGCGMIHETLELDL